MSARRHQYRDDSRRYQDRDVVPASVRCPSRETTKSSANPGSLSSTRGTSTYPTSDIRKDNTPSRSQIPRDHHERMDVDSPETRKRLTTSLAKDQGSIHTREEEGIKLEEKPQPRPPKEESQSWHDGDHTDDKRDTLRAPHRSSPKENVDVHRPPPAHPREVQPVVPSSASFQSLYEAQAREISDLKRERRVALEEKQALTEALAALRQQYDERSVKLSVARHERHAALLQRREIDDAYTALRQRYDEQTKEFNAVRHEYQATLERRHKAEEEYAALRQKYETQKNDYSALSNKYHSLKTTLEQRTSELQGVERFLTMADTFSGSEVVNMLRKLNEEVQQNTAFMAEWAVENFVFETPTTDQMTAPRIEQTRALETLGIRLMQLLGTRKHKDNPIVMEMALRAYLVYELYWVASPWNIGQEEQSHNVYIDAIYERIREAEGQAVSGNWRALTRAYTLPACISDPDIAHALGAAIASGFSDILMAAGCTTSKSDVLSPLWSKFGEKIHHFVSLAGQVNKITGVGVISEDFEVQVTWPDLVFDERTMEDSYDNGDRVQGVEREETVLCATELGLMQRMKIGAITALKGKPSEMMVIKPKVALVSVLDIIDG